MVEPPKGFMYVKEVFRMTGDRLKESRDFDVGGDCRLLIFGHCIEWIGMVVYNYIINDCVRYKNAKEKTSLSF